MKRHYLTRAAGILIVAGMSLLPRRGRTSRSPARTAGASCSRMTIPGAMSERRTRSRPKRNRRRNPRTKAR